jgi:acetyl-CoA synthetase
LKSVGVGKGDAVIIYLPMLLELPIAMLACARIGAVHSVMATAKKLSWLSWLILMI